MDQLTENVSPLTVQRVEHIREITRIWRQAVGMAGSRFTNRHAFSGEIEHLALPGVVKQCWQRIGSIVELIYDQFGVGRDHLSADILRSRYKLEDPMRWIRRRERATR